MLSRFTRYAYKRTSRLRRYLRFQRPIRLRLKEFQLYVRPDDWTVGMRIAVKRSYEAHVSSVMRDLLKPGMVVVDIGANIGYYTLLAAARIGETGKVLAFEPGADNCRLLQMSLEANGFRTVTLHPVAVADIAGVVGFATGGSNGSIDRDDPTAMPFQVQAVRLDDILQDEAHIDLVKMDIEGAEGLALVGMSGLLAHHKPIIFTEFSPAALQTRSHLSPEEFLDRIRDLGYDLHVLHRRSPQHPEGQHPTPQTNAEILRDYEAYQSDHIDLVAYPRRSTTA